ncbi:DNA mismatch repair protein MutS [Hyphomicrobium denitrificans 1NES1]|uniref:DNA mismatch repair protein MutS n=1 Tax=Hyphomicrobium denitrificans 1NES1 TaxID=670307 RepID=N0BCL2_9HYPH|nr:DNA mismatch repair protein MutS [Hyphomicrobium denitrificans]AGK59962.1 DNA mismatch repair protein MutS [Hyphomicrobium denitrificans 1NES1]
MSKHDVQRRNRHVESDAPSTEKSANSGAGRAVADATPSMAQYLEIKAANPNSLLWYRMGDFYELFFEDAVVASEALSIVLTKRGKHQGQEIPMCGVPVHRADEYLQRLIKQGYRVAVCEQLEDPAEARKRGAKAVVKRDVVRLVTPGTVTEEALLDAKARNYLTAVYCETPHEIGTTDADARLALASLDISTGEFEVGDVAGSDLTGELIRLAAREIIVADGLLGDQNFVRAVEYAGGKVTPIPAAYFNSAAGSRDLKTCLGVADLSGFGAFSTSELAAIGAVLKYVDLTQMGRKPLVNPPRKTAGARLFIDAASRASLELIRAASGEKSSTLLAAMDRTVTGAGARELQARLSSPLTDPAAIEARLDAVAYLVDNRRLLDELRSTLRSAPDLARALPRLGFGRGGPRDLAAVRDAIGVARRATSLIEMSAQPLGLPAELKSVCERLTQVPGDLAEALGSALVDDPPLLRRDGGFVRPGFNGDLDAARTLRDDSRKVMAKHEARYIEETGIKTLRVRHNNILGFFIEVTQLNAKPLLSPPLSDRFRHRQTMANAVRFATAELLDTEGMIASASERALNLEQEIFTDLAERIGAAAAALGAAAAALAELDVFAALAHLALEQGYTRPVIDASMAFEIRGGRHPVVQQALARSGAPAFIENDCILGKDGSEAPAGFENAPDARIWLVTGPNMAGKSTFLRQNALITVMAQMGSYVPARSARIGVVDRLFSRVGASDDLARGRSTFMVEMVETAAILNQASERSLVILDEIGRGTATFDGLSIAWATVEYLHGVTKARALFATHYHELTALARRLNGIANVTMDVTEWHDTIVFLHKVKAGAADRSYGIQVAKLAGLPHAVVARAREVLDRLEKADRRPRTGDDGLGDLPLFSAMRPKSGLNERAPSAVEKMLRAMHPDDLSPKSALEKIYELKALAETEKKTQS